MLTSLKIKNFRSLESIEIERLGRVNLIIGENNGGKSTLLEAVRIYCGNANPSLLNEIAASRGEVTYESRDVASGLLEIDIFQSMFTNRKFNDLGSYGIYIGDINEDEYVKVERAWVSETIENVETDEGEFPSVRRKFVTSASALDRAIADGQMLEPIILVKTKASNDALIRRNFLNLDEIPSDSTAISARRIFERWTQNTTPTPYSFVPTRMLAVSEVGTMWDKVALTDFEDVVVSALRVIDERIVGIVFVEQGDNRLVNRKPLLLGRRTALLKMSDSSIRVPLASSGDGVMRLLQIILSLYSAKNGVLLIDEFENGLHYSVQAKIWDSIFYHASRLNVQVFATTHSSDTLNAFSLIANDLENDGVLIQLSKSAALDENRRTIAITYDNRELNLASNSHMELR